MKILIDTEKKTLTVNEAGDDTVLDLYTKKAFEIISHQWLRVGWNQKYPYTFTWLGRPIIQIPEDALRMQEVIYQVKPDIILETGVAHGGSLIFYASLCKMIGKGKVIGVDIEIRPHNRKAIAAHELFPLITLVEGSSIAPETIQNLKSMISPNDKVLVILDSCHTKEHVAKELEAYCGFVTPGSYIVATDGSMKDLHDVPRGNPGWKDDHPTAAAIEFAEKRTDFVLEEPKLLFNESELNERITHWPSAFLRRKS